MTKTAEEWADEGDRHDDANQFEEAIKCFDQAIATDPNYSRTYSLKGFVQAKQKNFEGAAENYRISIEKGQDGISIIAGYGNALKSLGKFQDALTQYEKVLTKEPHRWQTL